MDDIIANTPAPVPRPKYEPVDVNGHINFVYFDLETTSFRKDCDILQLAAVRRNQDIDTYMVSDQYISDDVTRITHLSMNNGDLYYDDVCLSTVSVTDALSSLISLCQEIGGVILVAHNCKVFDAYRLVRHVRQAGLLDVFMNSVVGFSDTLPLFKDVPDLPNAKMATIANHFLGIEDYQGHNALDDATTLEDSVAAANFSIADLINESFTVDAVLEALRRDDAKNELMPTLLPLWDQNACSVAMIAKIASSGLNMEYLMDVFQLGGRRGIAMLFSEKDANGFIRVTKYARTISYISGYLSELLD